MTSAADQRYAEAISAYGVALERVARGYEADSDRRRDLLQDIHLALWRSFDTFRGQCSVRTWVYRVAHNVGITHVVRQRRRSTETLLDLEELASIPAPRNESQSTDDRLALGRLMELIHRLKPLDRQIMLLYLEEMDGTAIAELTGLSPGHVRVQIHRIKALLTERFHARGHDHD